MTHLATIHPIQTEILRMLLFAQSASFSELCKASGTTSDHFTFHLNQLVNKGIVKKLQRGRYRLSRYGKEYANQLDTDDRTIEKQPKLSVLLVIERQVVNKEVQYLVQKRLKQPFFGLLMFPTGKIRWGESFEDAASRELLEETGLKGSFFPAGVFRKNDYNQRDALLEDKLFILMKSSTLSGTLNKTFEGGENFWMSTAKIRNSPRIIKGTDEVLNLVAQHNVPVLAKSFRYNTGEY